MNLNPPALYVPQEIVEDIMRFEDVVLQASPKTLECVFMVKYSEHHTVPMGDAATVDDLKTRVTEFFAEFGLPKTDISPFELKCFGVYYRTADNHIYQLLAQFDETDYTNFDFNSVPAEATQVVLLDDTYAVAARYIRPLH
jgi:hypothetical protein